VGLATTFLITNLRGRVLRLRLPELLKGRGMTPYALTKASGGRIGMSTAHRLVQQKGRLKRFDRAVLEVLCDVLDVEPGELFEREQRSTRKART
jgi:DNA-binding Xre family transcriptional regulator